MVDLERRKDETPLQYHKRIVYGKLVDKTLADVDYTELAELIYGQPYASDVARRMFYGSKRTLELLDDRELESCTNSANDILSDIEQKMIELKKERQKFYDQRSAFNKVIRERSRQEELNEIIVRSIESGGLPALTYKPSFVDHSDNDLLISLNDIHFGAVVDNAWCKYNSDICASMMQKYIDEVVTIAARHNSENCIIACAGDNISGSIHYSIAVQNKESVIEQVTGVSELISQFVAQLSKYFNTVRFVSVAGNHSRLNPNKDENLLEDRLDNLTEWYMRARLQNFTNVIINDDHKLDPTISLFDIRGKNYCLCHGDYDGSQQKIQTLQSMVGSDTPICAVLLGHKHHNQTDDIQGVKMLMAGSFLGMDSFCVQNRIFGRPEQMVCVCDSSGVVCHYDIGLK